MRRSSNLLGKQMLLARRLCEAGCGFVTVSDCGWDMHANGNSPKNMAGLPPLASQVDHAVAAFLEDVHERGLSDKILLVVTGEMGRTPRRNRDGGRDHYANLTTLALAGGGLKMGQVIGQSDRLAAHPSSRALHAGAPAGDRDARPARHRRHSRAGRLGAGRQRGQRGVSDSGAFLNSGLGSQRRRRVDARWRCCFRADSASTQNPTRAPVDSNRG